MKLTSKGRYAVMAMADLAKNREPRPVSLHEISLRQGISILYLEQLFLIYFASILPAGPGINSSLTLLSISNIDYYFQKKTRLYSMFVRSKRIFFNT